MDLPADGRPDPIEYASDRHYPLMDVPCKVPGKQRWEAAGRPEIHNFAHNTAPDDAIYCGRGSPYGNPYQIGSDGGREMVIRKFEENVLPTLDIEPLRGKDLKCFCKPKACHCDSIFMKLYGYVPDFFN